MSTTMTVNDAATAYKGVIPADRWHEPYMPRDELRAAIDSGVQFWGWEEGGKLVGVMGIQDVQDVTLVRHAYVREALDAGKHVLMEKPPTPTISELDDLVGGGRV